MISLPSRFADVLSESRELEVAVLASLVNLEPWLERSGMPFFPGYTDHSPRHISEVLYTASSIISDSSYSLLSPADVTVLVLASLLHDSAMHLTEDSFRELVKRGGEPTTQLDRLSWKDLWMEYLSEGARFGDERLVAIFDDSVPYPVQELDLDNLNQRDKLFIGEFIRRHHARIAHEIAIEGVPGPGTEKITLGPIDDKLRDVIGLVARSHGMALRDTFRYIDDHFGQLSEYRGIKITFCMAVLRIADYIQVHSERAVTAMLKVRQLRSPISRQEWRNHFAVDGISFYHNDPEALYAQTSPLDVATYLKLKALFADIQRELDESWAVLGEVYGRKGSLAALGLTARRIRSNLDDYPKFARSVNYVPLRVAFDASNTGLLKLLVDPLYEHRCEVGIRELIQNATDACKERCDLEQRARELLAGDADSWNVLVEIEEESAGCGWVTVTDKGVGMTVHTLQNYFFKAGASFRDSEVWKRQHIDNPGGPRPLRGGRFGIGVLAIYLLGEEIFLTTRHFREPQESGVSFRARMTDSLIELRRCNAPVGTSIRVRVSSKDVFQRLAPSVSQGAIVEWDAANWFFEAHPRILYRWKTASGDWQEFRPRESDFVPTVGNSPPGWHALADPTPYKAIFWSATGKAPQVTKSKRPAGEQDSYGLWITVNGLRVQRAPTAVSQKPDSEYGPWYCWKYPKIAFLDPVGVCPINLQRNAITLEWPKLESHLVEASLRAQLLEGIGSRRAAHATETFRDLCFSFRSAAYVGFTASMEPLCCTRDGVMVMSPLLLEAQRIDTLVFIHGQKKDDNFALDKLIEGEAVVICNVDAHSAAVSGIHDVRTLGWMAGTFVQGRDLAMQSANQLQQLQGPLQHQATDSWYGEAPVAFEIGNLRVLVSTTGLQEELEPRFRRIIAAIGGPAAIALCRIDPQPREQRSPSRLAQAWQDVFGQPVLAHIRSEL